MPATHYSSYFIDKNLGLILCNYQGEITVADVIQLNRQIFNDKDLGLDFNILIDFTGSTAIAFKIEIQDYISFFRKSKQLKNKAKVGVLFNTPNQSFLLGTYKTLGKFINHEVELFRNIDDYYTWMGFNAEQASKIKNLLNSIKLSQ